MEENKKEKPVHEIKLPSNGILLKAAVWKHVNGDKRPHFTVAFTRSYKKSEGDKWTSSSFFQRDDLLTLARLSQLAHDWIVSNSQKGGAINE